MQVPHRVFGAVAPGDALGLPPPVLMLGAVAPWMMPFGATSSTAGLAATAWAWLAVIVAKTALTAVVVPVTCAPSDLIWAASGACARRAAAARADTEPVDCVFKKTTYCCAPAVAAELAAAMPAGTTIMVTVAGTAPRTSHFVSLRERILIPPSFG